MKVKIEKLDDFGRGIAYYDNKIVFVNNALIDEEVEIKKSFETKKYMEAKVIKYFKKSSNRVTPICPYYDRCGGCNIMHLKEKEQLTFKQEKVNNLIKKICKLDGIVNKIIYDKNVNYRNKVTLKVKDNQIGYYEKNSNNLVKIDYCYLLDNRINELIKEINKIELTNITDIMIRVTDNDRLLVFYGNNLKEKELLKLKNMVTSIYTYDNKYKLIYGKEKLLLEINGIKLFAAPDSFLQVNTNTCLKMYNKIKESIKDCDNLLDLYCGVGAIGIYVHDKCKKLVGVEVNQYAIEDANRNKELNKIENAEFYNGKANEVLKKLDLDFDYIVVDPPRNGLDNETIKLLKNSNTKNIIYVSCDIMTLTRDINLLKDKYKILEITPIDMFPNTYHVETITILQKR